MIPLSVETQSESFGGLTILVLGSNLSFQLFWKNRFLRLLCGIFFVEFEQFEAINLLSGLIFSTYIVLRANHIIELNKYLNPFHSAICLLFGNAFFFT